MPNYPQIKICGITNIEDAKRVSELGANAIGLVFYPPSSRHIDDLKLARQVALSVGPFTQVVSLFVDAKRDYINEVLKEVPINTIQFHGKETESFCRSFNRPYMRALRMKLDTDIAALSKTYESAKSLLLDAYKKGVPGGTGETFDWHRVPHDCGKNIVLAGGLTPDNIAQAVAISRPSGVDVSGGVEQDGAPRKKDMDKVQQFIENVKMCQR